MPSRFPRGSTAYTKDGRSYVVDLAEDGTVYCTADNGAETEFPESALLTEKEWAAARGGGKREVSYDRLRQSKVYMSTAKLDRAGVDKLLVKADRLWPGLLDFVAFATASRALTENREQALIPSLSIVKSRAVFDAAPPEARVVLLAHLLSIRPDALVSAANLGDNLMRAMLEKGMAEHAAAFEDFSGRRRT